MKTIHFALAFAAVMSLSAPSNRAAADTFGGGANTFDIEFVTVGNPGNSADTTGSPSPAGSVDYVYRIGKYEISRDMVTKASAEGNLGITLSDMTSVGGNRPDMPATGVSWNEAARFVDWLNTSEGFSPAYKFSTQPGDVGYNANANVDLWEAGDPGFDAANPFRNSLAHYFLPSVDEWYKAAYHDKTAGIAGNYFDFPTGSDTIPTAVDGGTTSGTAVYTTGLTGPADITLAGGLSPYGTMGQGGNVLEREETEWDLVNDSSSSVRGVRGGMWDDFPSNLTASVRFSDDTASGFFIIGYRVASIEEFECGLGDPQSFNPGGGGVISVENFSGTGTQGKNCTLQIELAGAGGVAGTDYDQLNVTGSVTLAGTLDLEDFGGYTSTAALGTQALAIVKSGDTISGVFDQISGVILPGDSNLGFAVTYPGDLGHVTADGVDVTVAPRGDADLNGSVSAGDLITALVNVPMPSRTWAEGDGDGDGALTAGDLVQALINVANFPAGGASATDLAIVPEPTTLMLAALGLLALGFYGGRRKRVAT